MSDADRRRQFAVAVRSQVVLETGAVVVHHLVAQRRHPVIGVEGKLDVVDAVRSVIIARGDVVDAVLDVFDRASTRARAECGEHRHLVQKELAAEAG
jgi:hypothetical protein